jgi:hypothetical protein
MARVIRLLDIARLAAAALAAAGSGALAQSVTVLPAAPQYMEPVYARVSPAPRSSLLFYGAQASMSGNVISIDLQASSECCGYYYDVMLGRFPAGTYKVIVPVPGQKTVSVDFTIPPPARSAAYPGKVPALSFTDLWWSPTESGWGLSIFQGPFNDLFATWMVYGTDGKPTWYLMGSGRWTSSGSSTTYEAKVFRTSGPHFAQVFDPRRVDAVQVGTATLTFRDSMTGVFRFDVEGVSGMKNITRMPIE